MNVLYSGARIINPASSMVTTEKDTFVCVKMQSEHDTDVEGEYYIIRMEPSQAPMLIDKILKGTPTIYVDVYNNLPLIPIDLDEYFKAQNLPLDIGKLSGRPFEDLIDMDVIEYHYQQDLLNWNTLGQFLKIEAPVQMMQHTTIGPFAVSPDDTTIRESIGTPGAKMNFAPDSVEISLRNASIRLDNDKVEINNAQKLDSGSSMRDQGMTKENPLNHILPDTLVTWPASKNKMYAVDTFLNVGMNLAVMADSIAKALKRWSDR